MNLARPMIMATVGSDVAWLDVRYELSFNGSEKQNIGLRLCQSDPKSIRAKPGCPKPI